MSTFATARRSALHQPLTWCLAILPSLAGLTACEGTPDCEANPELAGCPEPQAESGDGSADRGSDDDDGGGDDRSAADEGSDENSDDGDGDGDEGGSDGGKNDKLIDDMEDGDGLILEINGRQGYWYSFGDASQGTLFPDPEGDFEMTTLEKPRLGSSVAVRVYGDGWPSDGAGFGLTLNEPRTDDHLGGSVPALVGDGETYDLSGYQGVQFWARRGREDAVDEVRFSISDIQTDPRGDICRECYNAWGIDVELHEEWTLVTARFDELRQDPSWGDLFEAFRSDAVYTIQFGTRADTTFDIWIDDIALIPKE